jgi:hypothetical protein
MVNSARVRATHRILHWESDGGCDARPGAPRRVIARRGEAATYAGVSGVAAFTSSGASYTLGTNQPRPDFLVDTILGTREFAGIVVAAPSGDAFSFPYRRSPAKGPLTVYLRFVRQNLVTSSAVVAAFGGASGARLVIAEDATGRYQATYHNGTTGYTSLASTLVQVGTSVELRIVCEAGVANVVTLYQSLSFTAEETGSASGTDGAGSLVAAFAAPIVYLGSTAGGASPSRNVYRALMVDGAVSTLSSFRTRNWTLPAAPVLPGAWLLAEDGTVLIAEDGTTVLIAE